METAVQLVLIISIASLTIIFITVGIWVVLILKEIKKVIRGVVEVGNDIEEAASFVKNKVKESFNVVSLIAGITDIYSQKPKIKEFVENTKRALSKERELDEDRAADKPVVKKPKQKRRFFSKKS